MIPEPRAEELEAALRKQHEHSRRAPSVAASPLRQAVTRRTAAGHPEGGAPSGCSRRAGLTTGQVGPPGRCGGPSKQVSLTPRMRIPRAALPGGNTPCRQPDCRLSPRRPRPRCPLQLMSAKSFPRLCGPGKPVAHVTARPIQTAGALQAAGAQPQGGGWGGAPEHTNALTLRTRGQGSHRSSGPSRRRDKAIGREMSSVAKPAVRRTGRRHAESGERTGRNRAGRQRGGEDTSRAVR